jgi:thiol-disulfide isomerase/thioredoxin
MQTSSFHTLPTDKTILSRYAMLLVAVFLLSALLSPALASPFQVRKNVRPTIFFFWGTGCPHCAAAKPFLKELEKKYPAIEVRSFEVLNNSENLELLKKMAQARETEATGVPVFMLGNRVFAGFDDVTARVIETAVQESINREKAGDGASPPPKGDERPELISLPFFGKTDTQSLSLPVFTLVIAGLDSFNPCAFFVLFTLLSLIVHAHSRKRMLLIGGVFVFTSGLLYFLFMAAWMNLFFLVGHLSAVTWIAGFTALIISLINMKDFFFFKQGVSLSIPETSKPKLLERMRGLLHTKSLPAALTGSIVLAVAANSYELLCTAGFPMVYTRLLTMNSLSTAAYYAYLALYNLVYMIPLAVIVFFFVITLGSRKLTEWQGRVMKLVSGLMMFGLAGVLLLKPTLLQSAQASALLLLGVIVLSAVIVLVAGKRLHNPADTKP